MLPGVSASANHSGAAEQSSQSRRCFVSQTSGVRRVGVLRRSQLPARRDTRLLSRKQCLHRYSSALRTGHLILICVPCRAGSPAPPGNARRVVGDIGRPAVRCSLSFDRSCGEQIQYSAGCERLRRPIGLWLSHTQPGFERPHVQGGRILRDVSQAPPSCRPGRGPAAGA